MIRVGEESELWKSHPFAACIVNIVADSREFWDQVEDLCARLEQPGAGMQEKAGPFLVEPPDKLGIVASIAVGRGRFYFKASTYDGGEVRLAIGQMTTAGTGPLPVTEGGGA